MSTSNGNGDEDRKPEGKSGVEQKRVLPESRSQEINPKFVEKEAYRPEFAEQQWDNNSDLSSRGTTNRRCLLPIGIGLAITAIVIGILATQQLGRKSAEDVLTISAPSTASPIFTASLVTPNEIIEQFLDADTSLEVRLSLLRKPFNSEEVTAYLQRHGDEMASGIETLDYLGQRQMLDLGYYEFIARSGGGQQRYFYVVEDADELKIDWDAYARTGTDSWQELLSGKRSEAIMQVLLEPGRYYNFAFSDEQAFSAFLLRSPDCDQDIFGYTERQSTADKIIRETLREVQMAGGLVPLRMKLKLEARDDSYRHRQFVISHVLASAWVESHVASVQDLWSEPPIPGMQMSEEDVTALAERKEGPLMYQHGQSLARSDPEAAAQYFRKALEHQPDFVRAELALAEILIGQGQLDTAETHLHSVLSKQPTLPDAHFLLGTRAALNGDIDEALQFFESTVRYAPYHRMAINNLTWVLATHKDPTFRIQPRVVELAEKAVALGNGTEPSVLATLGVAYAAVDRFDEAVTVTNKALRLLKTTVSDPALEAKLTSRLTLFENHQKFDPL